MLIAAAQAGDPHLLAAVGETKVVTLANTPTSGKIAVKLESGNPGGSLKDRSALRLVEWGEKNGFLVPGGTIIESSSGNFGVALAMIGAVRGYRVVAVVDPKLTPTNRGLLVAYGAEVVIVDEPDDSGSYHKTRIALANELQKRISNSFRPDQCFNILNGAAHFEGTAPELPRSRFLGPESSPAENGCSVGLRPEPLTMWPRWAVRAQVHGRGPSKDRCDGVRGSRRAILGPLS
jgi:cysteine synthase